MKFFCQPGGSMLVRWAQRDRCMPGGGHAGQGPPTAPRVAWRGSQAQAPLPAQPAPSRAPGAVGTGDPLLSPQRIHWALSSPINRLPGVRGTELPDLCPAGPPPLPPSQALWGQGLASCWLQTGPAVAVATGSGCAIIRSLALPSLTLSSGPAF